MQHHPLQRLPGDSTELRRCAALILFMRQLRAAIGKLRADNIALKEELMLENKFSVAPTQASAAALIANLQAQSDVYTAKVRFGLL